MWKWGLKKRKAWLTLLNIVSYLYSFSNWEIQPQYASECEDFQTEVSHPKLEAMARINRLIHYMLLRNMRWWKVKNAILFIQLIKLLNKKKQQSVLFSNHTGWLEHQREIWSIPIETKPLLSGSIPIEIKTVVSTCDKFKVSTFPRLFLLKPF